MKKKLENISLKLLLILAVVLNTIMWVKVDGFMNIYTITSIILFYLAGDSFVNSGGKE